MKLWTTEAGFRVAGIMRWPEEIESGQTSDQVVSALDFLPTFCALAELDLPENHELDGMNFLPALSGKKIKRKKPLVWAYYNALNDHRIAMAFTIANLVSDGEIIIDNPDCANISFPGFKDKLAKLQK